MAWREEHIGNARLILGDCRAVLPTLGEVAHVISDPKRHSRCERGRHPRRVSFAQTRSI